MKNSTNSKQDSFDFKKVESYWQDLWLKNNTYKAEDLDETREKKYILTEFPYPSGSSLHVGHCFRYTVPDVYSRFLRMSGYNVLFPIGWDAFGLPTEERARKEGKNPVETTNENIANFKAQVLRMGYGFDWDREIATTDPEYYKWTQWIFGEFYRTGLAEQKEIELWWCPEMGTVLANEEIIDGPDGQKLSERGEYPVYKKDMKQWVLKMPKYAEKLLNGLEQTNFPEHIKDMQKNWIGRSEGTTVQWEVATNDAEFRYPFYEDKIELYEAIENAKKENRDLVACTIVRNSEGRFLVMKRADWDTGGGKWDLPGGGVDNDGKDIYENAKRELLEESGIKADFLKYSHSYDYDLSEFGQPERKFRSFIFYVESDDPVILNEEHSEYKWININEVEDYLNWRGQKEALYKLISKIYPTYNEDGIESNYDLIPRERAVAIIRMEDNHDHFVAYLKPTDSDFHFFGAGTLDENETALEASIRETEEELGLSGLRKVSELGVCHKFLNYRDHLNMDHNSDGEISYNIEHYFLLECPKESWENRQKAEVDDKGGQVVLTSESTLRKNGWPQLNWILDNLERLEENRTEILLATRNHSKIKRYKDKLQNNKTRFITTYDLGIKISEPPETGKNEWENAKIKAKAYYEATGKVSMSQDTGLYFDFDSVPKELLDNLSEQEKTQPGKDSQEIAGATIHDSQEVRFEKMLNYYTKIASKVGGQIKAYFKDVYCIFDGKDYFKAEGIRKITFTDEVHGKKDIYFPLCSFYTVDSSGKYYHDLTKEEMNEFLKPGIEAIDRLLTWFIRSNFDLSFETFTTRVDTLPAVSFVSLAPEHNLVSRVTTKENKQAVEKYLNEIKNKSDRDRQIGKEKTGVFTGSYAKNPLTGDLVPIWVADYVLAGYGSGAVMGVAGHDERDFEFAKKFGLEIRYNVREKHQINPQNAPHFDPLKGVKFPLVVEAMTPSPQGLVLGTEELNSTQTPPSLRGAGGDLQRVSGRDLEAVNRESPFTEYGILFDSGDFNGLTSKEAKEKITEKLVKNGKGKKEVNYKFRDWVFSRQRYWGEPFPFEYIKEDKQKVLAEKEKTKYLIFDFDGVLGDTLEAFVRVAKEKLSPESTVEEIRQKWFIGHHEEAKYRRGGDYTEEEAEDTLRKRRELGDWVMESGFAMFDDFIEEIKKIKNAKLAVVSSGSESYVKVYCERIGLPFTHVLGSETDLSKETKVETVAEDWGIDPKEIYFFTDTKSDVLELWDNLDNSKIFGCSWGWHGKERLSEVLPEEQILTAFDQIHDIFEKEKYTEIDGQFYKIKLLPEKDLPLVLPEVEDYQPSKDGRSPLIKTDWINILNQNGEEVGRREADTMPNWAGSSWYYLRYIDPKNPEEFADKQKLKYWLPVDHYFGGSEHTTLHLLYSRFWHKFLFDKGYVPTPEPYDRRTNGGILLAEDGTKMSKSKGNVINPDEKLELAGSDALRLYISFIGPYDTTVCWQEGGLKACKRLVDNIWSYKNKVDSNISPDKKLLSSYHKMVKKITEYSEEMKNNVAVAEIMTFSNLLKETQLIPVDIWKGFLQVVAPFAPHITEELWYEINNFDKADATKSIHLTSWPKFNPDLCIDDTVTIAVQVNGKLRGTFEVAKDSDEEAILTGAKMTAEKYLEGKEIKFSKVVPNKLVTFAVK